MSLDPAVPVTTRRRLVVFWLGAATSFLLYLHRYTWNLIRPELQQEYGFSNTTLEAIANAFYWSYALGSIPAGMIVDFLGPHLMLVGFILAWSLVLPLHAATGNVWGLGFIRFLFGAAQSGTYPALGHVTQAWFPRGSRTRVQGWIASFFGRGGGAMSSVLMGTLLMGWCGVSWQAAIAVMAVPGVVFALVFWAVFRNSPADDPRVNEAELALIRGREWTGSDGSRRVIPVRRAFQNFSLRVLVVLMFLTAGADVVYTLLMGSFFKSLGVADMKQLGWLVSLPLIGGALGGVVGGTLNDRLVISLGSRWGRSLVGICGMFTATLCLFLAISQPTPERVAVGLFFVKFFTDWTQPTVWGTTTDIGGRFAATVFSIANAAGNSGALIMPFVIGPLLDYFTVSSIVDGKTVLTTSFTPMFVVVGTMYVGAGLCWFLVDCTKSVHGPDPAESA